MIVAAMARSPSRSSSKYRPPPAEAIPPSDGRSSVEKTRLIGGRAFGPAKRFRKPAEEHHRPLPSIRLDIANVHGRGAVQQHDQIDTRFVDRGHRRTGPCQGEHREREGHEKTEPGEQVPEQRPALAYR